MMIYEGRLLRQNYVLEAENDDRAKMEIARLFIKQHGLKPETPETSLAKLVSIHRVAESSEFLKYLKEKEELKKDKEAK